jgi:hypothetical protein
MGEEEFTEDAAVLIPRHLVTVVVLVVLVCHAATTSLLTPSTSSP